MNGLEDKVLIFTIYRGRWEVFIPDPRPDPLWSQWQPLSTEPTLQHAIVAGAYYAMTRGTA